MGRIPELLKGEPWSNIYYRTDVSKIYNNNCTGSCGIYKEQIDSYSIKKLPGLNQIKPLFTLKQEFHVLFARSDFYNNYLQPLGIKYRPVKKYKSDDLISEIVQLDIPITDSSLKISGSLYDKDIFICETCNRKYYTNALSDLFPPFESEPNFPIFLTKEYFNAVQRHIIVSREILELFINNNALAFTKKMLNNEEEIFGIIPVENDLF